MPYDMTYYFHPEDDKPPRKMKSKHTRKRNFRGTK